MTPFDFGRLRWRILLGNLVVAAVGAAAVAFSVGLFAPQAFFRAMGMDGSGGMMGGMMNSAMDVAISGAFGDAIAWALALGVIAAGIVAILVSVLVSTRLAGPISALASASREIAAGRYDRRVPDGTGELGDLAASFNRMASSLEATEQRRLELVGDVAHELRTPISTIGGYVEALEDGVFEPGPETWRVLDDATHRLSRLVDDLSELWRAEAREIALAPVVLDGETVVAGAVARHRPAAATRSIELRLADTVGVMIRADRARLDQVLDNLIGNAIRYTPEGGHVAVSLSAGAGVGEVAVTDSGPGLTRDQLRRVFERFYRVDPSRSREAGGSGLGLAIAKALTEAMGGRIWVTSPGPGFGSTFALALPSEQWGAPENAASARPHSKAGP